MNATYILRISCPDRVGLVNEITSFFKEHGHNIIEIDQYVDLHQSRFFMRIAFTQATGALQEKLGDFMGRLNGGTEWDLHPADHKLRVAIFVTRESHCLLDILSRSIDGELPVEIPLIISNHEDLGVIARQFNIPFKHIPVTAESKSGAEAEQLALLKHHQVDVAVLAKYMQIVSPDFIQAYRNRIINIHHSFLPAFPGARPYHSAYYRGVKIIGATSHFVTEELDAGPIIEQDVIRVKHSDSIEDLKRKGKEVEKNVLSRALWYYANRRIMTYGNKTILF